MRLPALALFERSLRLETRSALICWSRAGLLVVILLVLYPIQSLARIGWYGIRIAVAYGGNDIHHRDQLGETNLQHRNFSGKGVFAFLDDREIYRYRRFVQLHHYMTSSELERPNLRRQVKLAREQGWAGEEVGLSPGSQAVTLPVRDETGTVIGSMTVNGPVIVGGDQAKTLSRLMAIRDELETLIKTTPDHLRSPYAHFDPERITIRLPEER